MSESAWGLRRRLALSQEDTYYTSDGAWTQLRGLEGVDVQILQEALADERHVTARKLNHYPHLGEKSATCSFSLPMHDSIVGDASPLFESAFGFKSTNTTLTFSSSPDGGSVVTSAGTFDPIVLCTSGGVLYARPIKSVSGGTGTFAIKLPGAATTSANAATNNGALYYYDPTAETKYIQIEADRASETDSLDYILKGGYVTGMTLELDLQSRMMFGFQTQFHSWSQATASNAANPSAPSGHFLGLAGEAFVQDAGTPAAGTQLDVARVSIDLVCERIPRRTMRAPGGTVPDSAVVGVYSGRFVVGGLRVTYTKISSTPATNWAARTAKHAFFSWHMGRPAASTTADIVALSLPKVIPSGYPTEVDLDGLVGLEVPYVVEEDVALTAPYGLPALGFFSAA
jgi:hypothetical protein